MYIDNRLMSFTKQVLLKSAFKFAERLLLPHRFNKEKKIASKDFCCRFIKNNLSYSPRNHQHCEGSWIKQTIDTYIVGI